LVTQPSPRSASSPMFGSKSRARLRTASPPRGPLGMGNKFQMGSRADFATAGSPARPSTGLQSPLHAGDLNPPVRVRSAAPDMGDVRRGICGTSAFTASALPPLQEQKVITGSPRSPGKRERAPKDRGSPTKDVSFDQLFLNKKLRGNS
jgi:hypothetical protein